MMKDENTGERGKNTRDRETSEGDNGKVWVYNGGSNGATRMGERGNNTSGGERGKDGGLYNGIYKGDNKEE